MAMRLLGLLLALAGLAQAVKLKIRFEECLTHDFNVSVDARALEALQDLQNA